MNDYKQYNGASLYGNYRTRTFANVFFDLDTFESEWQETPFYEYLNNAKENLPMNLIFMLLYSRYGNSNVASSDENRFKYQLFSIIFQYAPTWQKELEIQKDLRALNIDEVRIGTTNIVNQASNPSTIPTTQSNDELPYINNQNVSKNVRSTADGYALLLSLLKEDVTESFLNKFKKLFLTIVEPELPLWYITYPEEE